LNKSGLDFICCKIALLSRDIAAEKSDLFRVQDREIEIIIIGNSRDHSFMPQK